MPTRREGPPGPGPAGATDPSTGTDGADEVRPELAGTRPGYSGGADTDPFARTELIGSSPPELRTPVGTPVQPLADTNVDPGQDVHPGAIDAAAREAARRERQIEGLRQGTRIGRFTRFLAGLTRLSVLSRRAIFFVRTLARLAHLAQGAFDPCRQAQVLERDECV